MMKALVLGLLLCTFPASVFAITLNFTEQVSVSGKQIRLSDIATIDATDEEKAKLTDLIIGPAPMLGGSCDLTYGSVKLKLRQMGINPETVTFTGATSVKVTRTSTQLDGPTIASFAQTWLQQQITAADGEELVLTPLRTPNDLTLPEGKVSWQCSAVGDEKTATRYVMVDVLVDGRAVWHGMIGFKMERFAQVLVVKRQLMRGMSPDDTMVALERRDIAGLDSAPLRDLADIDGLRVATTCSPGTILTADKLEKIPCVKRNDVVRVRAVNGPLTVALMAVACEDGASGATIRVRNQQTRQEFTARVVGPGEMVMDL